MKALLILVLCACSSKSEGFKSNVAGVKLDGGKISNRDGTPFSGSLVAKGNEIAAIATGVLGDTAKEVAGTELTGLVVVLPVKDGLVEGTGTVHVDLHADKLNPEVARRSPEALAYARAKFGSIKIAEATFTSGRLHGIATVWAPTGKAGAPMKVAEVTFRDHVLDGPAIEYWPGTTTKKRELAFAHGVKAGTYREFHANGKPELETTLAGGMPDGKLEAWFANGAPREKAVYAEGKLAADQRWYPNGKPQRVLTPEGEQTWYSNGQPTSEPANGVIEAFHANGNLESRTTYEAGVKHGPYAQFYDDNTKWVVGTYDHGAEHGKHQRWWKNGKPALDCTYVNGQLDGAYKRWYGNGAPWEVATYARGKLVGAYKKWWKNGKLAEALAYTPAGELDGDYKTFYDSGAKWAVGKYVQGKPQGTLQRWFPDGTLGYVMTHDASGKPNGPHKKWWPNGKPRLEATYVEGRLDGDFKNWLADGTVYEIATFRRGTKVQTTRPQPNAP